LSAHANPRCSNNGYGASQREDEYMAQIIWAEPALDDLNDNVEYVAISNLYAAMQRVENIFNKVQRQGSFLNQEEFH